MCNGFKPGEVWGKIINFYAFDVLILKSLAYKNIGKRKDIGPIWCLSFGPDDAIGFLQVDTWWGYS